MAVLVWTVGMATDGVDIVLVVHVEVVGWDVANWVMAAADPRLADPRDIMPDVLPQSICTCCTWPLGSRICAIWG